MNRTTWTLAATVVAATLLPAPAQASSVDPEVDSSRAVAWPIEDVHGQNQDLVFPEANADGSVADYGDEIVLSADVFFAYNDATLNDRARAELATIVDRVRDAGERRLTVTGHTDSEGTDADNLDLSRRRAEAVGGALAAGLPGLEITADGKGESEPFATNNTDEGRALNRRVTLRLG